MWKHDRRGQLLSSGRPPFSSFTNVPLCTLSETPHETPTDARLPMRRRTRLSKVASRHPGRMFVVSTYTYWQESIFQDQAILRQLSEKTAQEKRAVPDQAVTRTTRVYGRTTAADTMIAASRRTVGRA